MCAQFVQLNTGSLLNREPGLRAGPCQQQMRVKVLSLEKVCAIQKAILVEAPNDPIRYICMHARPYRVGGKFWMQPISSSTLPSFCGFIIVGRERERERNYPYYIIVQTIDVKTRETGRKMTSCRGVTAKLGAAVDNELGGLAPHQCR